MRRTFRLDKAEGKLWGVCAGIADYTRLDATLVRVSTVIATLLLPWLLLVYALTAWLARPKSHSRRLSTARLREMEAADRRLSEIELQVAGADSRLAREIESLR